MTRPRRHRQERRSPVQDESAPATRALCRLPGAPVLDRGANGSRQTVGPASFTVMRQSVRGRFGSISGAE